MRESTDAPRVRPEAVGQERQTDQQNRSGYPGFLRLNGLIWAAVVLTAAVFAAVILIVAVG